MRGVRQPWSVLLWVVEMNTENSQIGRGWVAVVGFTAAFVFLWGLPSFGWLGPFLLTRGVDVPTVALWLLVMTGLASILLMGLTIWWLRRNRLPPAHIGWGRPATGLGWACALAFAVGWLAFSYFPARRLLPQVDVFELSPSRALGGLLGAVDGVSEELAMRGVVIAELRQIGRPTWFQIAASAVCSGLYHGLPFLGQGLPLVVGGFGGGVVLGLLLGGVFVIGGRSLMPPVFAHAALNLLGEPYLLMTLVSVMQEFPS